MESDNPPPEESGEQLEESCDDPDFVRENTQHLGGEVIVQLECKNCGIRVRNVYEYSHTEVRD